MNISINYKKKGNYDTNLNDILNNLDSMLVEYYKEHRLRTPVYQYNTAIKKIVEAFEEILEYSEFKCDINNENIWKKINDLHKKLIDSVLGYIDVTYGIMKCFYSKDTVKKSEIFNDKWMLKANKKVVGKYKKKIMQYRDLIAKIDNKLKHENGEYYQLTCSPCYSKYITRRCNGYYILGIDEQGVIEPDYIIHPLWEGKYVGISYNKDLRDILVNLYMISFYAAKAIEEIVLDIKGIKINIVNKESKYGDRLYNIIKKVNDLDLIFFPNEYNENLPEIKIEKEKVIFYKPCTKDYLKRIPRFKWYEISYICSIDSAKSFKLLYHNE